MRSSARRHAYPDFEERAYGMKLHCPACGILYEDDMKERRIILNGFIHNVCHSCQIAYLKVRVLNGERLNREQLFAIGQVRKKIKKSTS